MSPRLERLQALLEKDPANLLLSYGLAQELANLGRLEESVQAYRRLIETNPDYCAAYFQAARTLERMQQAEQARAMYRQGIAVAARVGNEHARAEMQAALDALG
jgi:tetratricopeptide (TPR) repeat protein